jgi:hypothetical protein
VYVRLSVASTHMVGDQNASNKVSVRANVILRRVRVVTVTRGKAINVTYSVCVYMYL